MDISGSTGETEPLSIDSDGVVGLLITRRCPLECSHCIVGSRSVVSGPEPEIPTLLRWIDGIAEASVKWVSITGGEPFLYPDKILAAVLHLSRYGLRSTVVTSAFWATSTHKVVRLLEPLCSAGLNGLGISYDRFHSRVIPSINVRYALEGAKRLGIRICLSLLQDPAASSDETIRSARAVLGDLLDLVDFVRINHYQAFPKPGFTGATTSGFQKDLICRALTPSIWPDGTVACCCGPKLPNGHPLRIGNLNRNAFPELYSRYKTHPLVGMLEIWGLERVHREAEFPPLHLSRNMLCFNCRRLFENPAAAHRLNQRMKDPVFLRKLALQLLALKGKTDLLLSTVQLQAGAMPNSTITPDRFH